MEGTVFLMGWKTRHTPVWIIAVRGAGDEDAENAICDGAPKPSIGSSFPRDSTISKVREDN